MRWGMGGTIHVVGVGNEGRESLIPRALTLVQRAEVLVGGQRLLDFFPDVPAERIRIGGKVDEILAGLAARLGEKRIVVLASGDPNFFGITRALLRHIPRESLEILPNVSALQWAFAKAREPWEDATFLSVHGRSLERLPDLVRGKPKLCLFTDETHSPPAIARVLLAAGVTGYRAILCENLGGTQERVTETTLAGLAEMEVHPLSTLILIAAHEVVHGEEPAWAPGLPEDAFDQRKPKLGLITKREIRILSLARLALRHASVMWDIGAGSGSVAVEAAKIARDSQIFAVEKDAEDIEIIRNNVVRFGVPHVRVLHVKAPEGLNALPDPDAVFVGGTGGQMRAILTLCARRLRDNGRIVVNAITLDNLQEAVATFRDLGWDHEAILVNIARSKPLLGMMGFEALNPVYILTAWPPRLDGARP